MTFVSDYLRETIDTLEALDEKRIQAMAEYLVQLHISKGRLFIIGNGGSAANASHAVNDFRKFCRFEAYAPDNMAEVTAWANDDGYRTVFARWLDSCRMTAADILLVLSVGGGSMDTSVSQNIVNAVNLANGRGAYVLGIVGRDGGFTNKNAHHCVIIPTVNEERTTPHVEEMQSIILHLLVSHPLLKK